MLIGAIVIPNILYFEFEILNDLTNVESKSN